MKCVVLAGYHKLELTERPIPKLDGYHVITKVSKCGICGTDFHTLYDQGETYKGMTATVIEPGNGTGLKIGDRVSAVPCCGCGHCDLCTAGLTNICSDTDFGDGAYATYKALSPRSVVKLPDDVSDDEQKTWNSEILSRISPISLKTVILLRYKS